ncbi:MAG TPA: hypothetical protein VHJ18_16465 [Streptosporangiaceae bacterium]|jgi:hypothetical protein|nr:hypothetical protein [Streptosporangiaceae bacterium]
MLADGRADGLIALDLDRAMRDRRDQENLIARRGDPPRAPLDGIAGRPDAAAMWDNLDLRRQRALLTAPCTDV